MTVPVILRIAFPWGRYHATGWGRHVNEGAIDWPPAPWRLLRALYATWQHRLPDLPADTVHGLLGALAAELPDYVVPPHQVAHTRHYMPDGAFAFGKIEEGRDKTFDTFAVVERGAAVYVRWPVDLPPDQHDALTRIATRVPYLGRAESVCEADLATAVPDDAGTPVRPANGHQPTGATRIPLLSPTVPLDLAALLRRGHPDPAGTRWVDYQFDAPATTAPTRRTTPARAAAPTAIRWTYTARAQPSITAAVTLGHVLRRACQSAYGRHNGGGASPTLSGRASDGPVRADQHSHAHYLALSSDGVHIDTLLVWAPERFSPDEVSALATLPGLTGHGHIPDFRPGRLGLTALGAVEHVVPELAGPATQWHTVTPFAPARHAKRGTSWDDHVADQIRFELRVRRLPAPAAIEITPGEALRYRRYRPDHERLNQARRATGIRLTFPEPVTGPLSLGALNHFGLGLFTPQKTATTP